MLDLLRKIIPDRHPLRLFYHKILAVIAAVSAKLTLAFVAAAALSLLGVGALLVAGRLGRAFERRLEPVGPRARARA